MQAVPSRSLDALTVHESIQFPAGSSLGDSCQASQSEHQSCPLANAAATFVEKCPMRDKQTNLGVDCDLACLALNTTVRMFLYGVNRNRDSDIQNHTHVTFSLV